MISIKSDSEIKFMREANRIVSAVLDNLAEMIKPGVSTWELNEKAEEILKDNNARAAFYGFTTDGLPPFKYNICASVNDEIVHGYSSKEKILHEGDIIGIDIGAEKNGFFGDSARTFAVGQIDKKSEKLMKITRLALERAIEKCISGNRIGDLSAIIEETAKENGFYVAENLTGHGVGRELHEQPIIFNVGKPGTGPRLRDGMTIAIEPMFNIGTSETIENEWVFSTADHSNSAHFEHTVLIKDDNPEILSKEGVV
ncbi:MAG: type I methionyl aminopeptidase [Candidatus Cloacimonetes bacterium]|nr:type I methionyl aminopeptidase [Candidatus Cloacimonadota bacterium]MBS3766935.1 type I methionyl aminopeptidase [Candidatus Cloacimonadota bacterium]